MSAFNCGSSGEQDGKSTECGRMACWTSAFWIGLMPVADLPRPSSPAACTASPDDPVPRSR